MMKDRSPRRSQNGPSRTAAARRLALVAAVMLALVLAITAVLPWQASRYAGAATTDVPALVVSPGSGPAGTTVLLSGIYFPRVADSVPSTLTFDGTTVSPAPSVTTCLPGSNYGFGFGDQCMGVNYTFQIPAGAAPGTHQFRIVSMPLTTAGVVYVNTTAAFEVTLPSTATPTITPTASSTPIVTPTASSTPAITDTPSPTQTGTAVPPTPSATATATATVIVAPSATNTPLPPTATATVTATPTPKVESFVSLIRPNFARDTVGILLRAGAGAKVHIDLVILVGGSHKVFSTSQDGVATAKGIYSANLKIAFPAHTPGQARLTIKETGPDGSKTVTRSYRYRVSR